MQLDRKKRRSLVVAIALAAFFAALAELSAGHISSYLVLPWFDHLGAENFNIATAIAEGRGFSDPFGLGTGPTAWMPPVLPYILAALDWVAIGDKSEVVVLFRILSGLGAILTAYLLLEVARSSNQFWLGTVLVAVGFSSNFSCYFGMTHDTALLVPMMTVVLIGLFRHVSSPPERKVIAFAWGAFGGLCALSGPVVGFSWAVGTTWQWFRGIADRQSMYRLLLAGLGSLCVVGPWILRDRLVMGAWMPIKSNAAYELWQAQTITDDGVVIDKTLDQHPWFKSSTEPRREYKAFGEMEFIQKRREEAVSSIRRDPADFLYRVGNRFLAFIYPSQFYSDDDVKRPFVHMVELALQLLTLASIVFGLVGVKSERTRRRDMRSLTMMYGAYVVPYIIVSFYDRYMAAIFPVQILLILEARPWSYLRASKV